MDWLIPSLWAVGSRAFLGGLLGVGLGVIAGHPMPGCILGAFAGTVLALATDRRQGNRVYRWLRTPQGGQAPKSLGIWGEVAYLTEREFRLRDQRADHERKQREQLLSAIEASPNGVLLLDPLGQISWCNSVSADHFGLNATSDRGQPVTHLVRAPNFVQYLQSGQYDHPVSFPGAHGHTTLSVLIRPYGEGSKLVLSQDITERVRSESRMRDFVANVSHEIRTPLTVLAGFVETMSTLALTDAERRQVLFQMEQQSARMQALVDDLLTLAKIEGGLRPPTDQWVPLGPILAQARSDASALSGGQHTISFPDEVHSEIAGNASELASALGNLVANAIRYTPAGGHVTVKWTVVSEGGAHLDVIDDGPGVAREHIPRLTERFYRVDGSRSRATGGTGLGLAIVKQVIQRHGGEIDIQSEPGHGSQFRLVFPSGRVRLAQPVKAG